MDSMWSTSLSSWKTPRVVAPLLGAMCHHVMALFRPPRTRKYCPYHSPVPRQHLTDLCRAGQMMLDVTPQGLCNLALRPPTRTPAARLRWNSTSLWTPAFSLRNSLTTTQFHVLGKPCAEPGTTTVTEMSARLRRRTAAGAPVSSESPVRQRQNHCEKRQFK